MSRPPAGVEAALAELRAEYARALPALVDGLADAARRGREDEIALRTARDVAHRIHGTAGSYGLTAIGAAAARAEEALDRLLEGAADPGPAWASADAAVAALSALVPDRTP